MRPPEFIVPRNPAILQPDINWAPYVAQGTLCLLAGVCALGVAVGWTLHRSTPAASARPTQDLAQAEAAMLSSLASTPRVPATPAPPPQMLLPQSSAPDFRLPPSSGSVIPPASPSTRPTAPVAAQPRPAAPRPRLPLDKQLKNPQAMEAVVAARAMREQGDMQATVESLKTADTKEPNHPEILGEMALTYEEMGISSKAESLWRQIFTMGEANAGGYYTLAASKIGDAGAAPTPPAPNTGSSAPVPVSLGPCRLSREPLPQPGERVAVHVPILAQPGARIDPSRIEIHVTLYESINGGARIEAVPPDRTSQNWTTLPLNWADPGGEAADVTYDLFTSRPASPDTRAFHGYVVKLYYQNKLAGEQVQPESLRNATPKGTGPAGLDNALFPK